ncbi:hypothetical protein CFP56_007288 [Quercus suber]|uniref:Uncharacterized protein n=1 Tax=Quercus suber TaxID=58331 RepID=A0AAW0L5J9_QUESU
MSKNKQHLKEYEEKNNLLMYKIIGLKLKNNELMVNHGETSNNLHLLRENIKDKELLMSKLECLENKVGRIQQELQKKSHEVEEGSKLQSQLLKQVLANT